MLTRLLAYVVALGACIALFSTTTLAYFSDISASAAAGLEAASFSLGISAYDGIMPANEGGAQCTYESSLVYVCPQAQNDIHTFAIMPQGTAQGYCVISAADQSGTPLGIFRTQAFRVDGSGAPFMLNIRAAAGVSLTFSASWGTVLEPNEGEYFYANGDTIEISAASFAEYAIPAGCLFAAEELDTLLGRLAEHYQVNAGDIAAYNGITDGSVLNAGDIIKIPNTAVAAPYVLPVAAPAQSDVPIITTEEGDVPIITPAEGETAAAPTPAEGEEAASAPAEGEAQTNASVPAEDDVPIITPEDDVPIITPDGIIG